MFQKNYITLLKENIADLKQQIIDLKTAHAETRKHDIEEIQSLRDELARTRLYLTPGIQNISTKPDTSGPPIPENTPTGGAWQRILRREMAAQQEATETEVAEKRRKAAEVAAKENPDGYAGQGGQLAS
jgi:hypothetical protein